MHVEETQRFIQPFVEALCEGNEEIARAVVSEAQNAGFSFAAIYLNIFAPSLIEIGERWERNLISIADEHLATAITERLIGELSPVAPAQAPRRIVLGCIQGEHHTIGVRMLTDMLLERGWRVLYLGANVPTEEWVRIIQRTSAEAVGLSANSTRHLPEMRRVVTLIRENAPRVRILIGGAALDRDPDFAALVRADVYDHNPVQALDMLESLIDGSSS